MRELPAVSTEPMQVWSRILRLSIHLDEARRATFGQHQLEGWEFDVLAALRRAGSPYSLSPGQLASETLVTSGTMTNRIDRLEERGLVRREPDPSDRRGVRVVLTDAGRSAVDDALFDLVAREHALLETLPPDSRAELATLLRDLVRAFGD